MATDYKEMSNGAREYKRADSAVFLRVKERYGVMSNMAGGFPLIVNGVRIRTSEALYQACRFPHLPEVQRLIIDQKSPMSAKMKSKPHRPQSRPDWNKMRVKIMRWCLEVKLAQNWDKFSEALLETGDLPIVEHSRRDDFWGAKPVDKQTLIGVNALGRLLMELRERVKNESQESLLKVEPLQINNFYLCGDSIRPVVGSSYVNGEIPQPYDRSSETYTEHGGQQTLVNMLNETTPININTAKANELRALPDIGPKLADRIVAYRKEHGPFQSVHHLTEVRGISPRICEGIAGKITY